MRFSAEEPESSFFDVPKKRKGKGEKSEKDKKKPEEKAASPLGKALLLQELFGGKKNS